MRHPFLWIDLFCVIFWRRVLKMRHITCFKWPGVQWSWEEKIKIGDSTTWSIISANPTVLRAWNIASSNGKPLWTQAHLHGDFDDEIYMEQLEGFVSPCHEQLLYCQKDSIGHGSKQPNNDITNWTISCNQLYFPKVRMIIV